VNASPRRPIALSVVVPAYNEAHRFEDGMGHLMDALARGVPDPETTEIVVVDDGSTDGTDRRAASLLAALPHHRVIRRATNAGKGAAVRAGVGAARGALIAFCDADMSIEPAQLVDLVTALDDAEVAIGSRSLPGSVVDYDNLPRTLMGRAFNRMVNAATDVALVDTQCGFKGFRAPVARLLFHFSVIDRFAFDVEVLRDARRLGLRIAEVPVRWQHVPDSRVRPLRDPLSMLADIARSRTGLRRPPPVPAVVAGDGAPAQAAVEVAGVTLPVLRTTGGTTLVLFPLCEAAEFDRAVEHIGRHGGASDTVRRLLTLDDLEAMAPLTLVAPAGRSTEVPSRAPAPAVEREAS